ncbi:MAG: hypothetical protein CVT60_01130 [Actinobacteria bacterium HGW-Actinobacteria-10]|nr:MAG: hypothetical protein CVT60_01130 [Actinobacteria bacterium HGW-Actinobacteria-10]
MKASNNVKRAAIAALFVAEIAGMAAIAYGSGSLPQESVICGRDDVKIEVNDQKAYGAFSIARVVTPVDGWVVVRADRDGSPAEVIGAEPVKAGESTNVAVATDPSKDLPDAAFVCVVADRGTKGEFEYTSGETSDSVSLGGDSGGGMMGGGSEEAAPVMTNPMDWPLVHDRETVSGHFSITPFRVTYRIPEANIGAAFLEGSGDSVNVARVDAPAPSWVVIMTVSKGGDDQNEIIGASPVPQGRTDYVGVEVSKVTDGSEISALLVADLGAAGVLEVDVVDPPRSVDAPYFVRSWYVYKRVAPTS